MDIAVALRVLVHGVEHGHVRAVGGVQRGAVAVQIDVVVAVEEGDKRAAGGADAAQPGAEQPLVAGVGDDAHPRVAGGVFGEDGGAAVRAGVVHADDLDLFQALAEQAVQAAAQPALRLEDGHDDG